MRLSEIEAGTPIKIKVCRGDVKVAEILGKIRKNTKQESLIDVYYYEGKSVNLNSPEYEIQAVAYRNGEQQIEWKRARIQGDMPDNFVENRDSFRIYIGEVVECIIKNMETPALLIDLSEGGFRILVRDFCAVGVHAPVMIEVDDEEFNFKIHGTVVWEKKMDNDKYVYGCSMKADQNNEIAMKYLKKKQQKLLEEIQKEINRV